MPASPHIATPYGVLSLRLRAPEGGALLIDVQGHLRTPDAVHVRIAFRRGASGFEACDDMGRPRSAVAIAAEGQATRVCREIATGWLDAHRDLVREWALAEVADDEQAARDRSAWHAARARREAEARRAAVRAAL